MEKTEFKTTLTAKDIGKRIEIENFNCLSENEHVIDAQCKINWQIEPKPGTNGISFWNIEMTRFDIRLTIEDIETRKIRFLEFDNGSGQYEMEINSDDYKMKYDFIIGKIVIDRKTKLATAFIGH